MTDEELTQAVAERVMSLIVYPSNRTCRVVPADETESGYPESEFVNLPPYATDIAAAWQVVEAMQRRGYFITIGNGYRSDMAGEVWSVEFARHPESYGKHAGAVIAPRAICLAALAALEADRGAD